MIYNGYFGALLDRYLFFYASSGDRVLVLTTRGAPGPSVPACRERVVLDLSPFSRLRHGGSPRDFQARVFEALARLEGTFDYVAVCDLFMELEDIQGFLERLAGVCHPRTRVVFNFYNHLWVPFLRVPASDTPPNWITRQDADHFLALSGFQRVTRERRVLLPVPVPLLSRVANTWLSQAPGLSLLALTQIVVARPVRDAPARPAGVSVVIPARNEAGTVADAVRRIPPMAARQEIIFVEGHSSDGTWEAIQQAIRENPDRDIRAFRQTGQGKGDAVRLGFSQARGDVLMILDSDLSMPPEDLPKYYRAIAENAGEFINGCRLVYPMERYAMQFLNLVANKLFGYYFSFLLGQSYRDTLCGTKVLWRRDYAKIEDNRGFFGDFDPFGDFDLIFGAAKLGLKTLEIPVRYHTRRYGQTNISRFRHGLLLLRMCLFVSNRLKFR